MLQLIEISFICAGIHVCFMEGMIFERLRIDVFRIYSIWHKFKGFCECDEIIQKDYIIIQLITEFITKPLYDCLPCMASFWTCVILWKIDIKSMLIVCGMNAIIASLLQFFDNTKLPEND